MSQLAVLLAITASSTLCYVVLLIVVVWGSSRRGASRLFSVYLTSSLVWNLGSLLMLADPPRALMWNKVMVAGLVASFFTFFHFTLLFLNRQRTRKLLIGGYALLAVLFVLDAGGFVIRSVTVSDTAFSYEPGPAMGLVFVSGYLYLGLALTFLVQRYWRARDEFFRNKLRYLIGAMIVMMVGGASNAHPQLGAYGIDHLAYVVAALLVAYAILRYRLLDLRFVIRRGLIYTSLTIFVTASYFLLVFLVGRLFGDTVRTGALTTAVAVALLVAAAFVPLKEMAQGWFDRLFFRERRDYQELLATAGRAMMETLDLGELATSTMDRLEEVMHVDQMGLFILEGSAFVCRPELRRGVSPELSVALQIDGSSPLVLSLTERGAPLGIAEIETQPEFRGLWRKERELLRALAATLLVPLKSKGQLVGLLWLGPKRSEEPWAQDELDVLTTLASQLSVAVENARLFHQISTSYEELKSSQDSLIQSERLQAIGQMASGIAHDFNNRLAAILGHAEIALERVEDPKMAEDLSIIADCAREGATTVRRLQTFTKLEGASEFAPVDLNEVVTSTFAMLDSRRREREEMDGVPIELRTSLQPMPPISGSRGDIRDALINLLVNAMDAMPRGGTLTVQTRQEHGVAVLEVADTGTGIPESVRKRVFEPFFTTKGTEGTGLGLSVVFGIVSRHNGIIEMESEEGRGTTFRITLPLGRRFARRDAPATPPASPLDATVLVVEDDPLVSNVLKQLLTMAGCRVSVADRGDAGIARFREERFDAVLTDLGLPGMSGRELARGIAALDPDMPILLITGWGVQLDVDELTADGITGLLSKPFSSDELMAKLSEILENRPSRRRDRNLGEG